MASTPKVNGWYMAPALVVAMLSSLWVQAGPEGQELGPGHREELMGIDATLATFMLDHNCPGHYQFTVSQVHANGVLTGMRYIFSHGGKMAELPLRNGRVHGTMRYWSESGALLAEIPFSEGKLHGTSRFFDNQGTPLGTSEFEEGTGAYKVWRTWGDKTLIRERRYRDGVVVDRQAFPEDKEASPTRD